MSFSLDNEEIYKKEATIPHDGTSDALPYTWHYPNKVYIEEGLHTFEIASTSFGTYVTHILFEEEYTENNEYVLAQGAVINYVNNGRALYPTETYQDYTTSIITDYVTSASDYYDRPLPATLRWDAIDGASSYTLTISTSESFDADSTVIYENLTETVLDVYNLFIDTSYWWKVETDTNESSEVKQFKTADTVRWIYVDGIRNVRDLGGWNGLKQGLVFRGSEMNAVDNHNLALTEDGKKVLHDDLEIKTDLDFRQASETGTGNITESPIGSDVSWKNISIGNFTAIFNEDAKEQFKSIMELFADTDNYPIYMHCWGGADRTGTIAFLLEGLCGVSEEDLSIDFELTSFASFGNRYRYDNGAYLYASMLARIKAYEGDTLQEKFENYALQTLGLTVEQVSSIQSILSDSGSNKITINSSSLTAKFELSFGKPVTGTLITALYCGKELVGVSAGKVNDLRRTVIDVPYHTEPDSAKVMVWRDLNQIEPLETALTYTAISSEWYRK